MCWSWYAYLPCTSTNTGSLVSTSFIKCIIGITARHVTDIVALRWFQHSQWSILCKSYQCRCWIMHHQSEHQVIRVAMAVQLNIASPLSETFIDCGMVSDNSCHVWNYMLILYGYISIIVTYLLFVILLYWLLLQENEVIIQVEYRVQYWWTSSQTHTHNEQNLQDW